MPPRHAGGDGRQPIAAPRPPFVLLDDSLSIDGDVELYDEPVEIVACSEPDEVEPALARIEAAAGRGLHAAGYLAYELGYALEPRLRPLLPTGRRLPLLWMGLFRRRRLLGGAALDDDLAGWGRGGWTVEPREADLGRAEYLLRIARILDYIRAGDVYQVNFTFRQRFQVAGDRMALYAALRRRQRVAHAALVRTGDCDVLSLSPELFVDARGSAVTVRPMKGTAARGRTPGEDAARRAWLAADEKSRAENLMIVDLLRNDLGRICEVGSIHVPRLFEVETYRTLHQMTSTIAGRMRPKVGFRELVHGLFPCGSITGAPKIRAMEIIRELEDGPRGVYTGAIGRIDTSGQARFNVAIRTLVVATDGAAELGIGSGVVADSDAAAEWEESMLKGAFLSIPDTPFELIETLRWTPEGGYALLRRHLDRLEASAGYFGFACERAAVAAALAEAADSFAGQPMRVRLLLAERGGIAITAQPLPAQQPGAAMRYALSPTPVDSADRFLYHKTTRRAFYDAERERLQREVGCDEAVFVNERGELTEGSYTNLFVRRGGTLLTPPVLAGLLDGTLRRELLEGSEPPVSEATLTPADLADADAVFLGNSVRGLVPAVRVG